MTEEENARKTHGKRLFVGGLKGMVTADDLRLLFEQYGPIDDCESKGGYGFVLYKNEENAAAATKALNETPQFGLPAIFVRVGRIRYDKQDEEERAELYVGNLPENVSEETIRTLFERFGVVKAVSPKNKFAFIQMETKEACQVAIDEINQASELGSDKLVVEISKGRGHDECFTCKRKGHFSRDCPRNRRSPPRRRSPLRDRFRGRRSPPRMRGVPNFRDRRSPIRRHDVRLQPPRSRRSPRSLVRSRPRYSRSPIRRPAARYEERPREIRKIRETREHDSDRREYNIEALVAARVEKELSKYLTPKVPTEGIVVPQQSNWTRTYVDNRNPVRIGDVPRPVINSERRNGIAPADQRGGYMPSNIPHPNMRPGRTVIHDSGRYMAAIPQTGRYSAANW